MIRRRVIVSGEVQGVGYRIAAARAAQSRRVAGWVRNRADGTVEAVFEGEPDAVDSMIRWCGDGPRGARVDDVAVGEEEPEGLPRFEIR
jgi:acylphosphatase